MLLIKVTFNMYNLFANVITMIGIIQLPKLLLHEGGQTSQETEIPSHEGSINSEAEASPLLSVSVVAYSTGCIKGKCFICKI